MKIWLILGSIFEITTLSNYSSAFEIVPAESTVSISVGTTLITIPVITITPVILTKVLPSTELAPSSTKLSGDSSSGFPIILTSIPAPTSSESFKSVPTITNGFSFPPIPSATSSSIPSSRATQSRSRRTITVTASRVSSSSNTFTTPRPTSDQSQSIGSNAPRASRMGLNARQVSGIVVGAIFAAIVLFAIIMMFFICRGRRKRVQSSGSNSVYPREAYLYDPPDLLPNIGNEDSLGMRSVTTSISRETSSDPNQENNGLYSRGTSMMGSQSFSPLETGQDRNGLFPQKGSRVMSEVSSDSGNLGSSEMPRRPLQALKPLPNMRKDYPLETQSGDYDPNLGPYNLGRNSYNRNSGFDPFSNENSVGNESEGSIGGYPSARYDRFSLNNGATNPANNNSAPVRMSGLSSFRVDGYNVLDAVPEQEENTDSESRNSRIYGRYGAGQTSPMNHPGGMANSPGGQNSLSSSFWQSVVFNGPLSNSISGANFPNPPNQKSYDKRTMSNYATSPFDVTTPGPFVEEGRESRQNRVGMKSGYSAGSYSRT